MQDTQVPRKVNKAGLGTIRNKIVFGVLVLILSLQVLSAVLTSSQMRVLYTKELGEGATSLSHVVFLALDAMGRTGVLVDRNISTESLGEYFDLYIQIVQIQDFDSILRMKANLDSITYMNRNGQLIASSRKEGDEVTHLSSWRRDHIELPGDVLALIDRGGMSVSLGSRTAFAFVPYGFGDVDFGGLFLEYDATQFHEALVKTYTTAGALVAAYMLVSTISMYMFISRVLTRPVRTLTTMMERMADGELDQWYHINSMDEIGEMGKSVNDLVVSLQTIFADISTGVSDSKNSKISDSIISSIARVKSGLRLLSWKLIDTIEEERKRFAADLHDGIGKTLTTLQFDLSLIEKSMEADGVRTKEYCRDALTKTRELAGSIRSTCARLRPNLLDEMGLAFALKSEMETLQREIREIEFNFTQSFGAARIDARSELALFRVFQEAVNNALKHARARTITVRLDRRDAEVVLEIEDDGAGFDSHRSLSDRESRGGIGLLSMKERIASLNGRFTLESEWGRGTTVAAALSAEERVAP